MWIATLLLFLVGAIAVLGAVLWLGWGRRKLGVSLLGAAVFLALSLALSWFVGSIESGPIEQAPYLNP